MGREGKGRKGKEREGKRGEGKGRAREGTPILYCPPHSCSFLEICLTNSQTE